MTFEYNAKCMFPPLKKENRLSDNVFGHKAVCDAGTKCGSGRSASNVRVDADKRIELIYK